MLYSEKKVYYYRVDLSSKKQECDFLLTKNNSVTSAIQVCYAFSSEKVKKREIDGLLEAMSTFDLQSGLILTDSTEDEITKGSRKIVVLPVWKWLLENGEM